MVAKISISVTSLTIVIRMLISRIGTLNSSIGTMSNQMPIIVDKPIQIPSRDSSKLRKFYRIDPSTEAIRATLVSYSRISSSSMNKRETRSLPKRDFMVTHLQ